MCSIPNRIEELRLVMEENGIDVYLIPTADFHQSEYVGEYFKAREYITGFTGSAGTAVITKDAALLWTDGRYFVQAEKELNGTGIELMKSGEPNVPTMEEYLESYLAEGMTLGFDGRVVSLAEGEAYSKLAENNQAKLCIELDLVGQIWRDRPSISKEAAYALDISSTGESASDKLARVRKVMSDKGATAHVLTTLDDICWLLNIRGNDIAYSPLVLSYAIVLMDQIKLYVDGDKFAEELRTSLQEVGTVFCDYNQIYDDLADMKEEVLLYDSGKLNYLLAKKISDEVRRVDETNPEILMKAIKNETEIENLRKAHIKDSVAHIRFMKWLKENYQSETIHELTATDQLDTYRAQMGNFISPSFEPISAFGEHAAMCHYSSAPDTDVVLKEGSFYLTDTGAGYAEGSTDVTRTYALGTVSDELKEHFTLTVMGNLRLAEAIFIQGTFGANLDILARQPFWERGLNFNHGTGHGVGYLLNIHEGPASICWLNRPSCMVPLTPGMVLSDEPGIYVEGSHGIRLENEVLVCEKMANDYGQFLGFETLTFIPFDLDAILPDVMTGEDKRRLNEYHRMVYEKTAAYLSDDEKEWLRQYTKEIE